MEERPPGAGRRGRVEGYRAGAPLLQQCFTVFARCGCGCWKCSWTTSRCRSTLTDAQGPQGAVEDRRRRRGRRARRRGADRRVGLTAARNGDGVRSIAKLNALMGLSTVAGSGVEGGKPEEEFEAGITCRGALGSPRSPPRTNETTPSPKMNTERRTIAKIIKLPRSRKTQQVARRRRARAARSNAAAAPAPSTGG